MESPQLTRVLLVQHDEDAARMLVGTLASLGFEVLSVRSAAEVWEALPRCEPHIVLLDLKLPDTSGLLLCADLKTRTQLPVIVCSVTSRRSDPALAFRLGADEFISHAIDPHELHARITSVLRRARAALGIRHARPLVGDGPVRAGALLLDPRRREARLFGEELALSRTEFDLLYGLAANAGRVVTREDIARCVWGDPSLRRLRTADVYVKRVREKLAALASPSPTGEPAPHIVTRHGLGYMLA